MRVALEQARKALEGAAVQAQALNVPVVIVVLDAGCFPLALWRMDGAAPGLIDLALGKARAAALFYCPSEDIWERARPGGPFPGLERSNGGLTVFAGGIPLRAPDGNVIGAIGVSGGDAAQDQAIAAAGVAAFDTG